MNSSAALSPVWLCHPSPAIIYLFHKTV